nr:succinyl-Coa ligase, subunit [Theileria orientalis]
MINGSLRTLRGGVAARLSSLKGIHGVDGHPTGSRESMKETKRWLNVTEYVGMTLLKKNKVPVPIFKLASTTEEAEKMGKLILESSTSKSLVVKAQVLTGGRGKGKFAHTGRSGVEVAASAPEAAECAKGMLGNYLTTKQTAGKGVLCNEVLLAEKLNLVRERYLSFMLDRTSGGIVAIATRHGGGNVEEIAEKDPAAVLKLQVCPLKGLTDEDVSRLVAHLDFSDASQAADFVRRLYAAFLKLDATLLEINPAAETDEGRVLACDSKISVDDNAKYRQQEVFAAGCEARTREESEAEKADLNYISLDGNVACIVNGAGLAMATLDLIQFHGGSAANFLDVGGNSTSETLSKALDIVNSDANAKVLLVNIVGGIVHCDKFATSFIEASRRLVRQLPVVIRLQGTNADVAKKLLNEANIPHLFCTDFDSACKSAVEMANS